MSLNDRYHRDDSRLARIDSRLTRHGILQIGRDFIETPSGASHKAEQRPSAVPTVAQGVA